MENLLLIAISQRWLASHISDPHFHMRNRVAHAYHAFPAARARYPHPLTRLCVWRLPPARLLVDPGVPGSTFHFCFAVGLCVNIVALPFTFCGPATAAADQPISRPPGTLLRCAPPPKGALMGCPASRASCCGIKAPLARLSAPMANGRRRPWFP